MRIGLFFCILFFIAGYLVGDRYGAPDWARSLAAKGLAPVEGWFGDINQPLPNSPDEDLGESDEAAEPEDDPAAETAVEEPATEAEDASPAAESNGPLGHPDNAGLSINDAGLQIIKDSEGLRLESYEHDGKWFIGYGHSRTAGPGMSVTEAEATELLREDVSGAEDAVRQYVLVPVNENQFSAMTSLAYNLGPVKFRDTFVVQRINEGDYDGAADAFLIHDRIRVNGELQSVDYLTVRREQERALFVAPA